MMWWTGSRRYLQSHYHCSVAPFCSQLLPTPRASSIYCHKQIENPKKLLLPSLLSTHPSLDRYRYRYRYRSIDHFCFDLLNDPSEMERVRGAAHAGSWYTNNGEFKLLLPDLTLSWRLRWVRSENCGD